MGNRLITVAAYDSAASAHIAQNLLAASGIDAVITDEQVVAMDFLLANAVGGIKVQIREGDAERAAEALGDALGSTAGVVTTAVDEDESTRQALAAEPESPEPEQVEDEPPSDDPVAEAAEPSERDEYAFRLYRAAVFSLVLFPLAFYALYLFLNATFGAGPLSPLGRQRLMVGGLLLFGVWGWWFVALLVLQSFS